MAWPSVLSLFVAGKQDGSLSKDWEDTQADEDAGLILVSANNFERLDGKIEASIPL